MDKTKIDWADSSWNPITGCFHNCKYCYAKNQAQRFAGYWDESQLRNLGATGEIHDLTESLYKHTTGKNRDNPVHNIKAAYPFGFDPTFHRYRLNNYVNKSGRTIFVCSMADLFGEWIPDEWIEKVFEACKSAPQHRYLFLTKNPSRYVQYDGYMPKNMWFGWTQTKPQEVDVFFTHHSWNTFVSMEPLRANFETFYPSTDWVIIGAETGNSKDKTIPKREWIENIVTKCEIAKVPVFMKNNLIDVWGENLIQNYPW